MTRHDGQAVALQAPPSDELTERVQSVSPSGNGSMVEPLARQRERFFGRDPLATLSERLPELLGSDAMTLAELRRRVEQLLPGHGSVLGEWLKHALRRGLLFERAPAGGGRVKTYARQPDLQGALRRTLAGLERELPALRGAGVSRAEVAAFLVERLSALPEGAPAPEPGARDAGAARGERASSESGAGDRVALLSALRDLEAESPRGALLSVRELRACSGLGKASFDRAALELAGQGRVSLHAHDHAAALGEAERRSLVEDARGVFYVGIASVPGACEEVSL